jgi:hypothetical protein
MIGFHFPSSVVERACISLGVTLSRSGHVIDRTRDWTYQGQQQIAVIAQNKKRQSLEANLPQDDIDRQALAAIKDLFPNIPKETLYAIVRHAFEKVKLGQICYLEIF